VSDATRPDNSRALNGNNSAVYQPKATQLFSDVPKAILARPTNSYCGHRVISPAARSSEAAPVLLGQPDWHHGRAWPMLPGRLGLG